MGISHEPALGQSPGNINPGIFLQSDSGYTMTVAERCLSHAHSHDINLLIIEGYFYSFIIEEKLLEQLLKRWIHG